MSRSVTVMGLGYIGLPTAAMLAIHGHSINGFDTNKRVLDKLARGDIHIEEPGLLAFVRDALNSGRLVPVDTVAPADVYMICVPTPFEVKTKTADLSYVEAAAKLIVPLLKKGDLIILESTVPAGTTDDLLVPILETSGLSCRTDLLVAHCPETVLPGNTIHELVRNHRVVGGVTPEATRAAVALYATFVQAEVVATTARTAEFVKLAENAFRDVNIAFANELAMIARELGIDAREAIAIANKHPRVNVHAPGPGVGGHCIPVDPWFLVQSSSNAKLLRVARGVNDAMPDYVARLVKEAIGDVRDPVIAVLGLAYKGNVDDVRESPSLEILTNLQELFPTGTVRVSDSHVKPDRHPTVRLHEAVSNADCVVIATDHDEYRFLDPADVGARMRARVAIDARGILDAAKWRSSGFAVHAL